MNMDKYSVIGKLYSAYINAPEDYIPEELNKADDELMEKMTAAINAEKQLDFDNVITDYTHLIEKRGFIAGFKMAMKFMEEMKD